MDMDSLYFVSRYVTAGVIGGLIQISVDYLFVDVFNRWYMEGVVVGFLFALVVVFLLHKYWTFKESVSRNIPKQFVFYTAISLFSLLGNVYFMYLFTSVLGVWYIWSQVLTIGIVSGISFIFNTYVTFNMRRYSQDKV